MSRSLGRVRRLLGAVVLFVTAVLLVNTFVPLGWLRPVVVAGNSMAPHYVSGSEIFVSGSESLVSRWDGSCRRWDVVVARSPLDAPSQDSPLRIIKRVVGLPGERLSIREGDIWINDHRVVKSPAEQWSLRLPVEIPHTIDLATLTIATVTDSLPANDRISRRLNRVEDLMIEAELHCGEGATWSVQVADRLVMEITGNGRARLLDIHGKCLELATLTRPSPWQVVVSSFDSGALLMVEGSIVFSRSEVLGGAISRENLPAIKTWAFGGSVEIRELSVWRDVYYEAMPVVGSPAIGPSEATWQLGPEDYFVVGDNQAISVDSRHGGSVPRRLIEGIVR